MHPFARPPTETERTIANLVSLPAVVVLVVAFVAVAWNVQSGSRGCRQACEERGAVDSTYTPARRQHSQTMPEECRCGFGEAGALAWRTVQP